MQVRTNTDTHIDRYEHEHFPENEVRANSKQVHGDGSGLSCAALATGASTKEDPTWEHDLCSGCSEFQTTSKVDPMVP